MTPLALNLTGTGKTLLITGAAGFIGARTVEAARIRGYQLITVDTREFFSSRPEHLGLDFGRIVDRDELFSDWDAGKLGRIDAGAHDIAVEFVNAAGDTLPGPVVSVTVANASVNGQILVNLPIGPTGTTE